MCRLIPAQFYTNKKTKIGYDMKNDKKYNVVYALFINSLSNNKKIIECKENEIDLYIDKLINYEFESVFSTKKEANKHYNDLMI
jgi:uncharacterized protein (UPF0254 family)